MKYGKWLIVLFLILLLPLSVKAYDYVNSNNESGVVKGRQSIYELYDLYEELFPTPEDDSSDAFVENNVCGSSSYMWPIGSDKTSKNGNVEMATDTPNTVNITSTFGPRIDPINGTRVDAHGAIDIAPASDAGKVNVIAAQSGEVTVASGGCTSFGNSDCGGGYGNYIVLKHDDGNYTLYAHLHQNTIKVKVGDKVSQGQVIAKVGSSGRSTGTHLHFQVHEGSYTREARVDPLNYVDPKKPRPASGDSCDMPQEFINFIYGQENGGVYNPNATGEYEAFKPKIDNTEWTIGPGLTNYVKEGFKEVGIDPNSIHPGTKISIKKVDKVFINRLKSFKDDTLKDLKGSGITLDNSKILALTSFRYNGGPASTQQYIDEYKSVGGSYKLYTSFCNYVKSSDVVYPGLIKRRKLEWIMYSTGIIINNYSSDKTKNSPQDTQSSDGNAMCVGNFSVPSSDKGKISDLLEKTASEFNGKISYY